MQSAKLVSRQNELSASAAWNACFPLFPSRSSLFSLTLSNWPRAVFSLAPALSS
ncbi:hypothetical protein J6590_101449, partial [Homalodisca vitripennis]